jgi:hypothetical protein
MKRKNCWEMKRCGREPEGKNATSLGVCPAALPSKYDGINGGKYGGRLCWTVTGTFNDRIQPKNDDAKHLEKCIVCYVLKQIVRDKKRDFILLPFEENVES